MISVAAVVRGGILSKNLCKLSPHTGDVDYLRSKEAKDYYFLHLDHVNLTLL
jgi:hypothetical protein